MPIFSSYTLCIITQYYAQNFQREVDLDCPSAPDVLPSGISCTARRCIQIMGSSKIFLHLREPQAPNHHSMLNHFHENNTPIITKTTFIHP